MQNLEKWNQYIPVVQSHDSDSDSKPFTKIWSLAQGNLSPEARVNLPEAETS